MTPIERAARALAGWTPNVTSWRDICENTADAEKLQKHYLGQARAVLLAIREPGREASTAAFNMGACGGHEDCWRMMIDALLNEAP